MTLKLSYYSLLSLKLDILLNFIKFTIFFFYFEEKEEEGEGKLGI